MSIKKANDNFDNEEIVTSGKCRNTGGERCFHHSYRTLLFLKIFPQRCTRTIQARVGKSYITISFPQPCTGYPGEKIAHFFCFQIGSFALKKGFCCDC